MTTIKGFTFSVRSFMERTFLFAEEMNRMKKIIFEENETKEEFDFWQ